MIRVVVADDHHLVRQGIRALLDRSEDIEVVGEADDGQTALDLVASLQPDVIVLDVTMPAVNGIQAAETLRHRGEDTAVVMLTMHADAALFRRAVAAGVRGYVLKESIADDLLLAIRTAHRRGTYFAPELAGAGAPVRSTGSLPPLTNREREVLELIADGLTNKAIAARLDISIKTVERHRTAVMRKLDAHTVVELLRTAVREGYVTFID